MALITEAEFERYTLMDITASSTPTSTQLTSIIADAEKKLIRDITLLNFDEHLELNSYPSDILVGDDTDVGSINGSNKIFYTRHRHIADIDFDSSLTSSDVRISTVSDSDVRTDDVSVDAVDGYLGKITLTTAPTTSINHVLCEYRYYINNLPYDRQPQELIKQACAYMAAQMIINGFIMRRGDLPGSFSLGGFSVSIGATEVRMGKLLEHFEAEYSKRINDINNFSVYATGGF